MRDIIKPVPLKQDVLTVHFWLHTAWTCVELDMCHRHTEHARYQLLCTAFAPHYVPELSLTNPLANSVVPV